jgi:hypothetical protein
MRLAKRPMEILRQQNIQKRNTVYNALLNIQRMSSISKTREHVSRSLVQVTGLSEYQAYQTMMRAHLLRWWVAIFTKLRKCSMIIEEGGHFLRYRTRGDGGD